MSTEYGIERLTTRRLDQLIGNSPSKPRPRSASTPNETIPEPCRPGSEIEKDLANLITEIETKAYQGNEVYVIAYLMYYNSMRVNEVLNLKGTDINQHGWFYIKASKQSKHRIGNLGIVKSQLVKSAGSPNYIFDYWNYRSLHYQFTKHGILKRLPGKQLRSVTHLMRHASVILAQSIDPEKEALGHQLGHRSEKSISYYGT